MSAAPIKHDGRQSNYSSGYSASPLAAIFSASASWAGVSLRYLMAPKTTQAAQTIMPAMNYWSIVAPNGDVTASNTMGDSAMPKLMPAMPMARLNARPSGAELPAAKLPSSGT